MSETLFLNHLSFPTVDVEAEARFFQEQLGASLQLIDPVTGSALLKHGVTDIVLEKKLHSVPWHQDFHFGFELDSRRAVEELHQRLRRSGAALESGVFNRFGRGSRFMGRTPGGIQFEVNTREDMETRWTPLRDAEKRGD